MAEDAKQFAERYFGRQHPARQAPKPRPTPEQLEAAAETLTAQPPATGLALDIFDEPLRRILSSGDAHARSQFAATSRDRVEGDRTFRRARAEAASKSPGPRVRNWRPVIAFVTGLSDEQRAMIDESDFYKTLGPIDQRKLERLAAQVTQEKVEAEYAEHGGAPLFETLEDEPEVDYAAGEFEPAPVKDVNDTEGQAELEAWLDEDETYWDVAGNDEVDDDFDPVLAESDAILGAQLQGGEVA
jgi:hypothetical protein